MVWFLKDHLAFNCLKRFILALAVLILQRSCNLFVDGGDSLSLGTSLRGKQTITSKNGLFELGFFNPNGTSNWYVCIWYAHIPAKTIIWVANRETCKEAKVCGNASYANLERTILQMST
ncbi:hypothetical protein SUGI_0664460 [Cryptomeria japonica]|nr:hypothetical protein SUGI_0664460 [Cryptomeria japonica]